MKKRFYYYCNIIIDNIEGGYYSPERHYSEGMGISGETMFGMDRRHGGAVVNDSEPGRKFWKIINANSAAWPWNYKGGANEAELRKLAAEIMWISYEKYSKMYLTEKARKKVAQSPKLEVHFYYACWNGPGRFQQFANDINKAIEQGITSTSRLEEAAINSRLNHSVALLRQGGVKMRDKIWPQLKSRKWLVWSSLAVAVAGVAVGAYYLTSNK